MYDLAPAGALAQRQHGVVAHRQLLALGWSAGQVKSAARHGMLCPIRVGVYAVAGGRPTWERAVLAAALAAGPGVTVSHLSAARLWGLPIGDQPPGIHLLAPPGRIVRIQGAIGHRSKVIEASDVTVRDHIPVTSAARTVVDASAWFDPAWAGRAIDDLVRAGHLTLTDVRACAERLAGPGRRRSRAVRVALSHRIEGYDPGDSDLELRVLRAILRAGLPRPVQQHRVVAGGRRCYLDLAYPDHMIAMEVDGWEVHGTRSAFSDDRARANELVVAGWHVIRFTSDMSDERIADVVRRALAHPLGGAGRH